MKRINQGLFLLTFIAINTLFPVQLISRDAPVTTAGSKISCPGSTVSIPITVTNFTQITAISLRVDFDPAYITYTGCDSAIFTEFLCNEVTISASLHKIMISWSNIAPSTLQDGSRLLNLKFVYLSGAPALLFNDTECEYADENGNPMNDTPTESFYINSKITGGELPVSVSIAALSNTVCEGTSVTFTASPVNGGPAPSYQWKVNGTNVGSDNPVYSYMPTNNDLITCLLTSNAACATGSPATSNSVTMVVNQIPAAPLATSNGDTLISSATAGNQWYFEGGPIPGATGQTHVATLSGWYWCSVTLNGCSSDTSNHVHVIITGMLELPELKFAVYPVPNDGRFAAMITSAFRQIFTIQIYNKIGQPIYEMSDIRVNGNYEQQFDLRPVPTGIYTVVLRNQEGVIVRKIIITK